MFEKVTDIANIIASFGDAFSAVSGVISALFSGLAWLIKKS